MGDTRWGSGITIAKQEGSWRGVGNGERGTYVKRGGDIDRIRVDKHAQDGGRGTEMVGTTHGVERGQTERGADKT